MNKLAIGLISGFIAHSGIAAAQTVQTGVVYYDYDELGQLIAKRGNDGQNFRYGYDLNGELVSVKDSLGNETTLVYDALGRLSQTVDARSKTTGFEYDPGDRLKKVVDPRGLITTSNHDGFGQLWQQTSPDTGTTTYQYDIQGLRTTMTRADGSALAYGYDALGRLTSIGNGAGQVRSYTYDSAGGCAFGKGKLCTAASSNGEQVYFSYTPEGRMASRRDFAAGYDFVTGYAYDGLGRLSGIAYPSGVSVGYSYAAGRLDAVTATVGGTTKIVAANIAYQPFGGYAGWSYGNGLDRRYNYDLDGRITGISAGDASTVAQSLTYGLDANNAIERITNAVSANYSETFEYDELRRLTQEHWPAYAATHQSFYDDNGNKTRYIWGPDEAIAVSPGSNRVTAMGTAHGYTYDARGNRATYATQGSTALYGYDAFNRLDVVSRDATVVSVEPNGGIGITLPAGDTSYDINALDQRAGKNAAAGTTRFVYLGQNQMLAEYGPSGWKSYLWLGSELIGLVTNAGALDFIHTDHLGRPEIVTDQSRQTVWKAYNFSFDRQVALDTIGGLNLGLPGQYYDAETNSWHNGFRDYDSRLGRYLQSDPIGLAGGLNTYIYAGADPVNHSDPFGLQEATRDHVANNGYEGERGSIGDAMLTDTRQYVMEVVKEGYDKGLCTMMCGLEATIGVDAQSMAKNAEQAVAAKAAKEAGKGILEACMSKTADKLAGWVTPGVDMIMFGKSVYDFGNCEIKCF